MREAKEGIEMFIELLLSLHKLHIGYPYLKAVRREISS